MSKSFVLREPKVYTVEEIAFAIRWVHGEVSSNNYHAIAQALRQHYRCGNNISRLLSIQKLSLWARLKRAYCVFQNTTQVSPTTRLSTEGRVRISKAQTARWERYHQEKAKGATANG